MQLYKISLIIPAESLSEGDDIGAAISEDNECYFHSIWEATDYEKQDAIQLPKIAKQMELSS